VTRSSRFEDEWNNDRSNDDLDDDEGPDGDDDFDYEEFVDNEFGGGDSRSSYSSLIKVTTLILLAIMFFLAFVQFGL